MPNHRRNRVPGATYFFTVNLFERKSALLIGHIAELREAVCIVRKKQPFRLRPMGTLMPGWFYPITCMQFGHYHPTMIGILTDGERLKRRLRKRFQKPNITLRFG